VIKMRNRTGTKLRIKVPKELKGIDKVEIGYRIIDFIQERTREGLNVYGRPWSPKNEKSAGKYTKEYAKEKGYSDPVDLEDTGAMLDAIKYFKGKKGEIIVGYKKGTKQERKAEGNIIGSYGRAPNPRKARPFLDILQKDVNKIVKDYFKELEEEESED